MAELFSCNPDCTLSDFGTAEWLAIVLVFILGVVLTTLLRKWAFEWNRIPESRLMWHVPRFVFVSFVVLMITVPSVILVFGWDAGYLYGKVIAPEICIVVYLLWLALSDGKTDKEENNI